MPAVLPKRISFRSTASQILAFSALLALAGCAQQQPTQRAHESTLTDAQSQAQGRAVSRTPTQIQLGFGDNATSPQTQTPASEAEQASKAAIAAQTSPLREAKTFLGTLPCLLGGSCEASRTTLTLAPNGQWRARSLPLMADRTATASAQQGCWEVIGVEPWRIRLRIADNESSAASLTFVNDNQLRVNSVNDHQPMLEYHLTRQADIDGITELDTAPEPSCR